MQWQRPGIEDSHKTLQLVQQLLSEIEACDVEQKDIKITQLSEQFDGFKPKKIVLKPFDEYDLSDELKGAIKQAAGRIEKFCQFQKAQLVEQSYQDEAGVFGFSYKPIQRIAAYIPGGRFPLISTALMTLIPAQVSGCEERIACSPSDHPAILAAASLAGATDFIRIGGAQAIGAMALGYQDLKPVHMIVGPGNQYVNAAKQLLQNRVAIDVAAGPSELLILANKIENIEWIIADMAAQAEHDPQAVSLLLTDNQQLLKTVAEQLADNGELQELVERQQIILLQADNVQQMIEFSERYAAEHLLLIDRRIEPPQLKHYGSLFIGENSAVAFGDYCAGPNHTLPTLATANRSSGLSVLSFLKQQSFQQVSDVGRAQLAWTGQILAQAEQLVWHKRSMQVRS